MIDDCIFTGFPLDPADSMRADAKLLAKKLIDPTSHFILYARGRPLMSLKRGMHPAFKHYEDVKDLLGEDLAQCDWVFLGMFMDEAFFALNLTDKMELPDKQKFIDLRSVALQVAKDGFSDLPSLLGRGKMLLDWNERHKFCANCGHSTGAQKGGYSRKCPDQACGMEHFPRTDPVVIMLVTDGDKCLMGRGKGWPEGQFSALAGFMEPGETIEEATRREVFEEAGIKVGKVTYQQSQPWPFPASLMIGVQAEALTTDITLDEQELVEAKWMDREALRKIMASGGDATFRMPPNIAIARHLLDHWLAED